MKARRKVLEFMAVTFLFCVGFSFHPFSEDYAGPLTPPVASSVEVAFPMLTIDATPPPSARVSRSKRK